MRSLAGKVALSADDRRALDRLCAVLRDVGGLTGREPVVPPDTGTLVSGLAVLVAAARADGDQAGTGAGAAARGRWRAGRVPLPEPFGGGVVAHGPGGELSLQFGPGGEPTMGAWASPPTEPAAIVLFDVRDGESGPVLHVSRGDGEAVDLPVASRAWDAAAQVGAATQVTATQLATTTPVGAATQVTATQLATTTPVGAATPAPAAAPWTASHAVGPVPLDTRGTADPDAPVLAVLQPRTLVRVTETLGAWACVDAANGWTAWVDGRLLVPIDEV